MSSLTFNGLEGSRWALPDHWDVPTTDPVHLHARKLVGIPQAMWEVMFSGQPVPVLVVDDLARGPILKPGDIAADTSCAGIIVSDPYAPEGRDPGTHTSPCWSLQDGSLRGAIEPASLARLFPGIDHGTQVAVRFLPTGVVLELPMNGFLGTAQPATIPVQIRWLYNGGWMYRVLAEPYPGMHAEPLARVFENIASQLRTAAAASLQHLELSFRNLDPSGRGNEGWWPIVRPARTAGFPWSIGLSGSRVVVGPAHDSEAQLRFEPDRLDVEHVAATPGGPPSRIRWRIRQKPPAGAQATGVLDIVLSGANDRELEGQLVACSIEKLEPIRVRDNTAASIPLVRPNAYAANDGTFMISVDGRPASKIDIKASDVPTFDKLVEQLDKQLGPCGAFVVSVPLAIQSASRGPQSALEVTEVASAVTAACGLRDGRGTPGTGLLDPLPQLHVRTTRGWLGIRGHESTEWGLSGIDETRTVELAGWSKTLRDAELHVDLLVDNSGEIEIAMEHDRAQVTAPLAVRCRVTQAAVRVATGHLTSTGEGQSDPGLPPFFDDHDLAALADVPTDDLVKDAAGRILDRLVLIPSHLVERADAPPSMSARLDRLELTLTPPANLSWRAIHWRQFDGVPMATPAEWAFNDPRARWQPGQPSNTAGPSTLRGLVPILIGTQEQPPSSLTLACTGGAFELAEPVGPRMIWDPDRDMAWRAFGPPTPNDGSSPSSTPEDAAVERGDPARELLPLDRQHLGVELVGTAAGPESAISVQLGVRYAVPHLDSYYRHALPPKMSGVVANGFERVAGGWALDNVVQNLASPTVVADLKRYAEHRTIDPLTELSHALWGESEQLSTWRLRVVDDSGAHAFLIADLDLKLHVRSDAKGAIVRWVLLDDKGSDHPTLAGLRVMGQRLAGRSDGGYDLTVALDTLLSASADRVVTGLPRELTLPLVRSQAAGETDVLVMHGRDVTGAVAIDAAVLAGWLKPGAQPGPISWVESQSIAFELVPIAGAGNNVPNATARLAFGNLRICASVDGELHVWPTMIAVRVAGSPPRAELSVPADTSPKITFEVAGAALRLELRHPLPAMELVEDLGKPLALQIGADLTPLPDATFERVGDRLYITYASTLGAPLTRAEVCPGLTVTSVTRCHILLTRQESSLYRLDRGLIGWTAGALLHAKSQSAQATLIIGDDRAARIELNGVWNYEHVYLAGARELRHHIDVACWDAALPVFLPDGSNRPSWIAGSFPAFLQHSLEIVAEANTSTLDFCAFQRPRLMVDPVGSPQLDLSAMFALDVSPPADVRVLLRRPDLVLKASDVQGEVLPKVMLALLPCVVTTQGAKKYPLTQNSSFPQTPSQIDTVDAPAPGALPPSWAWQDVLSGDVALADSAFVDGATVPANSSIRCACWTLVQQVDAKGTTTSASASASSGPRPDGSSGDDARSGGVRLAWAASPITAIGHGLPSGTPTDMTLWILDDSGLRALWRWKPDGEGKLAERDYQALSEQILATARWTELGLLENPKLTGNIWTVVHSPLINETLDLGEFTGRTMRALHVQGSPSDPSRASLPDGATFASARPPTLAPREAFAHPTLADPDAPTSYLDFRLATDTQYAQRPTVHDQVVVTAAREVPFEADADGAAPRPYFAGATPVGHKVPIASPPLAAPSVGAGVRYQAASPRPGDLTDYRFGMFCWNDTKTLRASAEWRIRLRTPPPPPGDNIDVDVHELPSSNAARDGLVPRVVSWRRKTREARPRGTGANQITLALNTPNHRFVGGVAGRITAFVAPSFALPAPVPGLSWVVALTFGNGPNLKLSPLFLQLGPATRAEAAITFPAVVQRETWTGSIAWALRDANGQVTPAPVGTAPLTIFGTDTVEVFAMESMLRPPPTMIAVIRNESNAHVVGYGPDVAQQWEPDVKADELIWEIRGSLIDRVPKTIEPGYRVVMIRGDGAWSAGTT